MVIKYIGNFKELEKFDFMIDSIGDSDDVYAQKEVFRKGKTIVGYMIYKKDRIVRMFATGGEVTTYEEIALDTTIYDLTQVNLIKVEE